MTGRMAREAVGNFLKKQVLEGEMTWDRAEEISVYLTSVLKDELNEEQVKEVIPKLDDKYRELGGVVLKLMGE